MVFNRFIPAGAGNTFETGTLWASVAVYPRWRGEHAVNRAVISVKIGLSPLARGTLIQTPDCFAVRRFIPAGAGNTYALKRIIATVQVYPRWRGEHGNATDRNPDVVGLSPLARGTPAFTGLLITETRFIPAGAGNTINTRSAETLPAVYPRWRGEHTKHTYLFLNKFIPHQQSTN